MPHLAPNRLVVVLGALGVALASGVRAQEPDALNAAVATGSGPLQTAIVAETLRIERGTDGDELRHWRPALRLSAGDEVHYTVRVHNPGKAAVTNVVVTKRLPYGVRYQPGSAAGPGCDIQFSIDGARFAVPNAGRAPATKPGARKAPPVEYTHVRWILRQPLAPGATALLRFRATFS
jgi:uncharacterized repeat protein (TIGR01451 family)